MKPTFRFLLPLCLSVCVALPAAFSQQNHGDAQPLESVVLRVYYAFSQKAMKDREPVVLTDTMALTVGQNHSVYFDWNKKRNDSIHNEKANIPLDRIQSVNVFKDEAMLQTQLESRQEPAFITDESKGESARLFKNRTANEVVTLDVGPTEGMLSDNRVKTYLQVTETVVPQDWEMAEDTLTVLGYTCQKATTTFRGRHYTAWFTLEIPIGDGPWKLYGLPGMILKAEDADGLFQFHAIGITQTANETIEMPTDRKIVPSTPKQLKDYRKNRFKNLTYTFFNGGTLSVFQGRNPLDFNELEVEK